MLSASVFFVWIIGLGLLALRINGASLMKSGPSHPHTINAIDWLKLHLAVFSIGTQSFRRPDAIAVFVDEVTLEESEGEGFGVALSSGGLSKTRTASSSSS